MFFQSDGSFFRQRFQDPLHMTASQKTFTCAKSAKETLEKEVKNVQSQQYRLVFSLSTLNIFSIPL